MRSSACEADTRPSAAPASVEAPNTCAAAGGRAERWSMSWSLTWKSTASRYCTLLLVGLVIVLCAPVRPAAAGPVAAQVNTPLTIAVAEAFTMPDSNTPDSNTPVSNTPDSNTPVSNTPAAASSPYAWRAEPTGPGPALVASAARTVHQAVDALTARLLDGRVRAALPPTIDLGAIRAVPVGAQDPTRTASIFGERPGPSREAVSDRSVTGAAVAYGAPDAGKRGGIGTSSASTAGSGGSATAMLSGLSDLPVHAGFTVARHTTGTGTIHTSIQPLDRPG